jgi:hypothetical protein
MLSDPNTMDMVLNNPQIKPLLDANPQMRAMMSNPQMLQGAMSMMGGNPGGMGGLGNLGALSGVPQTGSNANPQSGSAGAGTGNLFAGLGNLGNISVILYFNAYQNMKMKRKKQILNYFATQFFMLIYLIFSKIKYDFLLLLNK